MRLAVYYFVAICMCYTFICLNNYYSALEYVAKTDGTDESVVRCMEKFGFNQQELDNIGALEVYEAPINELFVPNE